MKEKKSRNSKLENRNIWQSIKRASKAVGRSSIRLKS